MRCCRISLIFLGIISAIAIGIAAEGQEIGSFIAQLQNKEEIAEVRRKAAYALGQIGDPASVTVLIQALKDDRGEIRAAAAAALVRIGSPAVPELIRSLKSKDPVVRSTAAYALGRIGESDAIPALMPVLSDQRWGSPSKCCCGVRQDRPSVSNSCVRLNSSIERQAHQCSHLGGFNARTDWCTG